MNDKKTIGILYVCTGNYAIFWKDFYQSMEKYFIPEAKKHYFVFTDSIEIAHEHNNRNIHRVFQKNLGWPGNTLYRFEIFLAHKQQFSSMDFLFFLNANLLVVQPISTDAFLPTEQEKLVATLHPGFYTKSVDRFPYEKNPASTACIMPGQGSHYFAGGLNGGLTSDFIAAMEEMALAIQEDNTHGITAVFHDESHWNKYLLDKPFIKILSASYLYPEGVLLSVPQIILIRDKRRYGGHYKMRGEKLNMSMYISLTVRRILGHIKRATYLLLGIPQD